MVRKNLSAYGVVHPDLSVAHISDEEFADVQKCWPTRSDWIPAGRDQVEHGYIVHTKGSVYLR